VREIKSAVIRILSVIQTTEGIIGLVGVLATVLLIFADVLNRYWLHIEIMGISDLALYCFIFYMFVIAAFTTWQEGHISVDFIRNAVTKGRPVVAALYRVFLVLLAIIILSFLLPEAYKFMLAAIKYPEYGTLIRWFNQSWLQITYFVALVIVGIHLVVIAQRDIKELFKVINARSQKRRT